MPRATAQRTKYPGVFKRATSHGVRYDIAYRVNGRQRWLRGKHTNLEAAAKHRLSLLHESHHGTPLDATPRTVEEFVTTDWLPRQESRVAEGKLRSSTQAQYARDVRNHLVPRLGDRRLDQVSVEDVERLKDALLADGLSNDTTRRVENTLGYVLKLARKRRLISYNPVADADKPSAQRRTPDLPSLASVYELGDAAPDEEAGRLILFAAFTGLRISELFGLRWVNVDLSEGAERVRVVEQFYREEVVSQAKSRAGNRELILGPEAAAVLREQSVAQQVNDRPNANGLVFPSPKGTYWRASNFNRRVWQPTREAAGLPELKFHTLRYLYNSHIRAQGLPGAVTEQLMGHTDERTHRGYTRPIPGMEQIIRDAQSGLFARPQGEKQA